MTISEHLTVLENYRDNLMLTFREAVTNAKYNPMFYDMDQTTVLIDLPAKAYFKMLDEISLCNKYITALLAWDKYLMECSYNKELIKSADQYLSKQ